MSVEEENKAIARRYFNEILNQGKLEVVDELMSPDFVFTVSSYPEPLHGPELYKQELVAMMRSALPDWYFAVQDLVAQGDTVVGHWISTGTHTGTPLYAIGGSIPADGRKIKIEGMTWLRIVNGKIVESSATEDALGFLTQLGALPSQEAPSAPPKNNGSLVLRYFNELMNQGKLEIIEEIASPDFVLHIPTIPEPVRGHEGLRQFALRVRNAMPDIHYTVERQVVDGNTMAVRWRCAGTQQGEFLGVPPTGKQLTDEGSDLFHLLDDGKLAELWILENAVGLMIQLGVISIPQ
jgi:steroid delta-isomerase-like uncharacterized protein